MLALICRHLEVNPHLCHSYVEQHLLGISREQIGAWLMRYWDMPDELSTALRFQHDPSYDGQYAEYPNLVCLAVRLLRAGGIDRKAICTAAGRYSVRVQIGLLKLNSNLFLSPLAGYTTLPFRLVVREIGGVGLCTTDLVNARSLIEKRKKAFKLIETRPTDRPLAVQLFGSVPGEMRDAAGDIIVTGNTAGGSPGSAHCIKLA